MKEEETDRKRKGWGMLIFEIVFLCLQSRIRKLAGQIKHLSLNEKPLKLLLFRHSNHHSSPCKSLNKQSCFPPRVFSDF
jgi:hypothetical protein